VSIENELVSSAPKQQRNWLPLAIASGIVIVALAAVLIVEEHAKQSSQATALSANPDAYAPNLALTNMKMSESANLAGGKLTYLDGQITNHGASTVTAITVQVLFHTFAHEVAQNQTTALKLIRVREPYIDVEPVSASPIKPSEQKEFRLIFDAISPDWDGVYPEVRVMRVTTK
jgi:hypothetical protein